MKETSLQKAEKKLMAVNKMDQIVGDSFDNLSEAELAGLEEKTTRESIGWWTHLVCPW